MSVTDFVAEAPGRSLEQRMNALRKANVVRSYRAGLKRELKHRSINARRVIEEPSEFEQTMKILDLLIAMPAVGRVKANRWLSQARISPSKTLGGLTGRQRRELLAVIGQR